MTNKSLFDSKKSSVGDTEIVTISNIGLMDESVSTIPDIGKVTVEKNVCVKPAVITGLVACLNMNVALSEDHSSQQWNSPEMAINTTDNPSLAKLINNIESDFVNKKSLSKSDRILEIVSFKSLLEGWDGYGGSPSTAKSVANAIELLNNLPNRQIQEIDDLYPNPNGTVSIIWKNRLNEMLSVEIGNKTMSYFVKYCGQEPRFMNKVEVKNDGITELAKYVETL